MCLVMMAMMVEGHAFSALGQVTLNLAFKRLWCWIHRNLVLLTVFGSLLLSFSSLHALFTFNNTLCHAVTSRKSLLWHKTSMPAGYQDWCS